MDVAVPISTVAPSLEGPTLVALSSTNAPVNLTEIVRLAGRGSVSGVRKVLVRLVATGLVEQVAGGYVLNREHLAAPSVLSLASLHGELLARMRAHTEDWGDRIELVGLFGSAARRDGGPHSDIDLLVVAGGEVEDLTDSLIERVQTWTGNDVQLLVLTPTGLGDLRRSGEPLMAELERDLVVINGDRHLIGGRR